MHTTQLLTLPECFKSQNSTGFSMTSQHPHTPLLLHFDLLLNMLFMSTLFCGSPSPLRLLSCWVGGLGWTESSCQTIGLHLHKPFHILFLFFFLSDMLDANVITLSQDLHKITSLHGPNLYAFFFFAKVWASTLRCKSLLAAFGAWDQTLIHRNLRAVFSS